MGDVSAQIVCTFLVPDGWDNETMEAWFVNFLQRGEGDGLKDLLFLYECNAIFVSYDDTENGYHVMQIGKPI